MKITQEGGLDLSFYHDPNFQHPISLSFRFKAIFAKNCLPFIQNMVKRDSAHRPGTLLLLDQFGVKQHGHIIDFANVFKATLFGFEL